MGRRRINPKLKSLVANIEDATDIFLKTLRNRFAQARFKITNEEVIPMNFGRHRLVSVTVVAEGRVSRYKFYVIFQRRWFESFQKFFGVASEAVTVNMPILEKLCKHDYDRIVWVGGDGTIFWVDPRYMMQLVRENGWHRKTNKTGEKVAHLPLSQLTKIR